MAVVSSRRGVWILTVGIVALLINLPIAVGWVTSYRLNNVGVTTTATVKEAESLPRGSADPQKFFIVYQLPREADPEGREFTAEIDEQTFTSAQSTRQIEVVYLEGKPRANRVDGARSGSLGLWIAMLADLALVGALLLAMRFGLTPEKPLVLLATADVVRCGPMFGVDQDGIEYVVRGDVIEMRKGEIVVHAGAGREVRVVLGGHRNPVGYQQPAEVRGRELPLV
jgi:hypothetical protein